jgi:hypothetical protein
MRGTEEHFHVALTELAGHIRRYDNQQLKHIPFVQAVEKTLADHGWSKDEFYAELNKLRGIQMHPAVKKKRPTRGKRKPKEEDPDLPF